MTSIVLSACTYPAYRWLRLARSWADRPAHLALRLFVEGPHFRIATKPNATLDATRIDARLESSMHPVTESDLGAWTVSVRRVSPAS